MLLLKLLDPLPDQINDLPVRRSSVILRNIMQLVVQLTVDTEAKVFVLFFFGEFHDLVPFTFVGADAHIDPYKAHLDSVRIFELFEISREKSRTTEGEAFGVRRT